MRISGFTIARNAIKFNYPIIESIRSILPICDEFIVNVGDSEDRTVELIQSINDPKIKIIENTWDFSQGKEVLSQQTNIALSHCSGDWAFYLQSDEVVHEKDLSVLVKLMQEYFNNPNFDGLVLKWFHFFGSYYRYRIDNGWFQKAYRVIKNNGQLQSFADGWTFQRKDSQPMRALKTSCFIYHYGWVQPTNIMTARRVNAEKIGFTSLLSSERTANYEYGNLARFPFYFGTHPKAMNNLVSSHELSQNDWKAISSRYWWSPLKIFRIRYKTFLRRKTRICR